MSRVAVVVLVGAGVFATSAGAAEHGLLIDGRVQGCRSISPSTSACNTGDVVADVRAHFAEGRPYTLRALHLALLSGHIWLAGRDDGARMSQAVVDLVASMNVHHERELLDLVGLLPFEGMRRRLQEESLKEHPPAVVTRLREACHGLAPDSSSSL